MEPLDTAGSEPPIDSPIEPSTGRAARPSVTISMPSVSVRAVVTLLVIVGLAVGLAVQWRRASDLSSEASERRAVAATATMLAKALMSYDFHHLDRARAAVLAVSTKEFADKYRDAFAQGLQPLITQLKATAKATVRDVYVRDVEGRIARAVVVLDSEVQSTAGLRRLVGSYLEMELRREGSKWKVNEVTAVAAAGENVTPPGATPPTPSEPTTTSTIAGPGLSSTIP